MFNIRSIGKVGFVAGFAALALAAGCLAEPETTENPTASASPNHVLESVKIGVVTNGSKSEIATIEQNVAKLAIKQINAGGGIRGKQIEVVSENGECSEKSLEAAQKLINTQKVNVIVNTDCEGNISGIIAAAELGKTPVVALKSKETVVEKKSEKNETKNAEIAKLTADYKTEYTVELADAESASIMYDTIMMVKTGFEAAQLDAFKFKDSLAELASYKGLKTNYKFETLGLVTVLVTQSTEVGASATEKTTTTATTTETATTDKEESMKEKTELEKAHEDGTHKDPLPETKVEADNGVKVEIVTE